MGKSLTEMREEQKKFPLIGDWREGELVRDEDEGAEGTDTYDPDAELSDALIMLQDSLNLFNDIIDPRRKGKITKFLRTNIENHLEELNGYMSLWPERGDSREEEEEPKENWEVAFLRDLGEAAQGYRACCGCGDWVCNWQKSGRFAKCFPCVKKDGAEQVEGIGDLTHQTGCSSCGKVAKSYKKISRSIETKLCPKCYEEFERDNGAE